MRTVAAPYYLRRLQISRLNWVLNENCSCSKSVMHFLLRCLNRKMELSPQRPKRFLAAIGEEREREQPRSHHHAPRRRPSPVFGRRKWRTKAMLSGQRSCLFWRTAVAGMGELLHILSWRCARWRSSATMAGSADRILSGVPGQCTPWAAVASAAVAFLLLHRPRASRRFSSPSSSNSAADYPPPPSTSGPR
jgi:hypothetical protein